MHSRHIAFVGKSGAGITSVATNVAAALAEAGRRVAFIGCGARMDASSPLLGTRRARTLSDVLHDTSVPHPQDIAISGFKGVRCLEVGAPATGGCSGRIFQKSFDLIERLKLLEEPRPEFVIIDLPGYSISCHSLNSVLFSGLVHQLVLVTQADFATLRTVNEVLRALASFDSPSPPQLAGLVGNNLSGPFAEGMIDDFAFSSGVEMLGRIPRSAITTLSDLLGETVIENSPLSLHAYTYRKLARRLARLAGANEHERRCRHLDADALKQWAAQWAECIYEIDGGFFREGEGI